jgi:hypothetical protein
VQVSDKRVFDRLRKPWLDRQLMLIECQFPQSKFGISTGACYQPGPVVLLKAVEELQPRGGDLLNCLYRKGQDLVRNDLVGLPG